MELEAHGVELTLAAKAQLVELPVGDVAEDVHLGKFISSGPNVMLEKSTSINSALDRFMVYARLVWPAETCLSH